MVFFVLLDLNGFSVCLLDFTFTVLLYVHNLSVWKYFNWTAWIINFITAGYDVTNNVIMSLPYIFFFFCRILQLTRNNGAQ